MHQSIKNIQVVIILAIIAVGAYFIANNFIDKNPKAEMDILEYDFGKIKKVDGVVGKKFMLSNSGRENLIIGDITTSCGCTTATADKKVAVAGEKIAIDVKFDPNFHEEPKGRFSRSVFIPTNDPANQEIELKIFVEIIE